MIWRPLSEEDPPPRTLGASLDRIVGRLGGGRGRAVTSVISHWSEVVGPQMAAHSKPVSVRDGILVVAADHPAWATQVRLYSAQVIDRLSEIAGAEAVTEIVVKVEAHGRRTRS